MKYIKSCLIITMLLGVGYSECNESNWQDYYPDMEGCNLVGANLIGANLIGADLYGAWLQYADLHWADLTDADLTDAYCYGAFFVGANLEGTIFDGADLGYAYFDENEDDYDDVSYEAGAESVEVGDMNYDGTNDVLDVVLLVNNILNP